jgi:integrase
MEQQRSAYPAPRRSKRTLFEQREKGIEPRHARSCGGRGWDEAGLCECKPGFQAAASDRRSSKVIRKTFPTLQAAKNWRNEASVAIKKGELRASTGLTFNIAADAFVAGMKDGSIRNRNRRPYKPSVIRTYETWLDARLRPVFGASKLSVIDRNDVQDYADELLADGLDPSTVRNVLMPMRVIFRRARRRGEVAVNPTQDLELPAVEGTRDRVASPKEAVQLIEALAENDQALWATALYAGLRNGELRAFKLENDHGTYLEVECAWDDVAGEIEPKSKAGARKIPVCDHLRHYLDAQIARLGRDTGLLFGEDTTTPFDYGRTTRRAYASFKRAGLERITLHECRHSFRSYLDAIPAISETRADRYAGHADVSMRARYAHALDGQLATDAAALDEYLDAATAGKVVPLRRAS